MSAPMPPAARQAAWTVLALVVTMGFVWGWLPSSSIIDTASTADRATSAGAYVCTVFVLIAGLHLLDRNAAPRLLRLATTLSAVTFTVLAASAAIDLAGVSMTAAYADLKTGASGVLWTPWSVAYLALAVAGLRTSKTTHLAPTRDAEVIELRPRGAAIGTGSA